MLKLRSIMSIFLFSLFFLLNVQVTKANSIDVSKTSFISLGYQDHTFSGSLGGRIDKGFGFEIGAIFSNNPFNNYNDYPCPYSYTIIGEKKVEPAFGLDFLGFIDLAEGFSLFAGLGFYWQKYALISRSEAGGYYCQSTDYKIDGGFSAGIQFKFDKGFLGLAYHQLRGANIQIGLDF